MYCRICPAIRRKNCKTICKSLETFLSREENQHQGLLVDENLLNLIHYNREKDKVDPVLTRKMELRGVQLQDLAKTVRILMGSLSPEERRMIVLRFRRRWSYHDIAKELKFERRQRAHYRIAKLLAEMRAYLKTIYQL